MPKIKLDEDIISLSEFRSNVSMFLKQALDTQRPLFITENGKRVAVLLDEQKYEAMQVKLELLEDIHVAQIQLASGEGISHETSKVRVLERLKSHS